MYLKIKNLIKDSYNQKILKNIDINIFRYNYLIKK